MDSERSALYAETLIPEGCPTGSGRRCPLRQASYTALFFLVMFSALWNYQAWAGGNRGSGPHRLLSGAHYIGLPLKPVDPGAWSGLSALIEGRTLDVVLIFKESPATRVLLGFGPLPGHPEPAEIALILDCIGNTMTVSVTPGGFSPAHVDSQPAPAGEAEVRTGPGPRWPSFALDDANNDRPLDADGFIAAARRRIGSAVLKRLRVSGEVWSPTVALVFQAQSGAVVLRVGAVGGSVRLDLRGTGGKP